MKNVKSEDEQEIRKKEEEKINLEEKNKLYLKNINQNMNKSVNYLSKKEIFSSYFFSFFFSLCFSFFSIQHKGECIIINKRKRTPIKKDRNKNASSEDKKILRNDSNYEMKKINLKKKIFQYNIKIIIYIIIINSFNLLLLKNNKFLFELNFQI